MAEAFGHRPGGAILPVISIHLGQALDVECVVEHLQFSQRISDSIGAGLSYGDAAHQHASKAYDGGVFHPPPDRPVRRTAGT